MFGHDKDEDKNDPGVAGAMSTQPVNHGLLGIDDDNSTSSASSSSSTPSGAPTPPAGVDDFSSTSTDSPASSAPTSPAKPVTGSSTSSSSDNNDDLLNIKREALQELSPLIDHLEQDTEEKFKTTMMMIQASDNKDLIPQAFQAAKAIDDEKKRAQALLDIVNEINYFTHKSES